MYYYLYRVTDFSESLYVHNYIYLKNSLCLGIQQIGMQKLKENNIKYNKIKENKFMKSSVLKYFKLNPKYIPYFVRRYVSI